MASAPGSTRASGPSSALIGWASRLMGAGPGAGPGIAPRAAGRLGLLAPDADATARTVECLHCREGVTVPARATVLTCPRCYQRIRVDDVVVTGECSTPSLRTCGRVVVKTRSVLIAGQIEARAGLEVHGGLEGRVVSGGPVWLGPRSVWLGDLSAPQIEISPGARVLGGLFQIVPPQRWPEEAAPPA